MSDINLLQSKHLFVRPSNEPAIVQCMVQFIASIAVPIRLDDEVKTKSNSSG